MEKSVRENFQKWFITIRIEYSCKEVNLSNAIEGERKNCTAQPHFKRTYLLCFLPSECVFFPFYEVFIIFLFIGLFIYFRLE